MSTASASRLPTVAAGMAAPLVSSWSNGPLLYSHWLTSTLDAQTALWRQMERQMASVMRLWFDPGTPPPSAQYLLDAVRGVAPLGPIALYAAWLGWLHVCADAMRHDASQV
jgi:hypothetical protein